MSLDDETKEPEQKVGPDPFIAWMVGGYFQDIIKRRAAAIRRKIVGGEDAHRLLAKCLPYLRSTDAKALRTQIIDRLKSQEEETRDIAVE